MRSKKKPKNKVLPKKKADVNIALIPNVKHSMGPLSLSFRFSSEYEDLTNFLIKVLTNLEKNGRIGLKNFHQRYDTWFRVICSDVGTLEPIFMEVAKHNIFKRKFLKTTVQGSHEFIESDVIHIKEVAQRIIDSPKEISIFDI
ncbi:MAG: hypothetical protein AAGA77_00210 [Bacteroidota bacterium]